MILGEKGVVTLTAKDATAVLALSKLQNQAKRSACNFALKTPDLNDNQIVQSLKGKFPGLNDRYLRAAIRLARIPNSSPLWGGRKLWNQLQKGQISKKTWHHQRNKTLWMYGDKSRKGNAQFQITANELWIKLPHTGTAWIKAPLKLWNQLPKEALTCFTVQLTHEKGRQFGVHISWESQPKTFVPNSGCIGVDLNPTLIAWTELTAHGNLLKHGQIHLSRVSQASESKRLKDIELAACELVEICLNTGKPLVLENLNFGKTHARPKGKRHNRGFNRMRHNFCYAKLSKCIERRASKLGVPLTRVFAGYTSILGLAKFKSMYGLNRHTAAAMIIGRRGLGITQERQNFLIEETKDRNQGAHSKPRQEASASSGRGATPEKKTVCVRLRPSSIKSLQANWLRGTKPTSFSKEAQRLGQRPQVTLPSSKQSHTLPHADTFGERQTSPKGNGPSTGKDLFTSN
jgi:IS605 OrfB family transposase